MTTETRAASSTLLERWGAFAVRRRWYVLGAWLVALPLLGALALTVNEGVVSGLTIPGAESQEAADLLQEAFPASSGDYGDLVFRAPAGLDEATTREVVESLLSDVAALPGIVSVQSPYAPGGLLSDEGTVGIARVQFAEPADDVDTDYVEALLDRIDLARSGSLEVEFGGPVAVAQEREGPSESTALGLVAALIILYILFRAVVPTVLPIGTAMLGLVAGFALVFSMTALVDLSKFGPTIAAMLGLGVGIDYALFIVARHRENLGRGMPVEVAAGRALVTSGKSVIFAGGMVITSLLGLSFMGIPFVGWIGVAAAVMVGLAVLVAVTLLPALLGIAGRHALPRNTAAPDDANDSHHARSPWYHLGYGIMRRPYIYFGLSSLILLFLAIPLLDIRLGSADAGNNPTTSTARRAYDITAEAFGPGANGPLQLVVDGASAGELDALREAVAATPGVVAVSQP
ncbi:MAG TPA: MMPL family transporter, partial [Tepidiformaceae bacterium]